MLAFGKGRCFWKSSMSPFALSLPPPLGRRVHRRLFPPFLHGRGPWFLGLQTTSSLPPSVLPSFLPILPFLRLSSPRGYGYLLLSPPSRLQWFQERVLLGNFGGGDQNIRLHALKVKKGGREDGRVGRRPHEGIERGRIRVTEEGETEECGESEGTQGRGRQE